jgi:GMP synthase (glutamine-hydrolysing)
MLSLAPMKNRDDLKILLLQIRDDKETLLEEFYEFVEYGDLQSHQITVLNTFKTPEFDPQIIDDFDALFVGGSSDASVLEPDKYPFVTHCQRLLRYCYDESIPVFASCFGFQVVVQEMGGKIALDKPNMEMGLYTIELNEAANDDPLLFDFPQTFPAISGHKERAVTLPDNATLLASSELCPYHIIRMDGKPFYGFQFHPELNTPDLSARISRYRNRYFVNDDELQKVLDSLNENTPIANSLVARFVDRLVLTNETESKAADNIKS